MATFDPLSSSSPVSSRVCRLCLGSKGQQLYRIFGGGIADLPEKIYDITAIEIDDINGIPSLICELCRSQILMCHQFVLQCRVSDWKYKNLLGAPPVPQNGNDLRLSDDSSSSGIEDLTVDSERSPEIPAKATRVIPVKHDALRRLKNDDKQRRNSIFQTRKIGAKKRTQPLLDSSQIKIEPDLEGVDNRKKQCPYCGLLVIRLERHIDCMHSETPKHFCRICGKGFKVRKNLACHVNNHNGIRPYKCTQCDKSYSYQNSLYDHLKTHKNRFFCRICNAGFTHVNIMKKHMLTHRA